MKAIVSAALAAAAMILPAGAGARDEAKVFMTDHPEGLKFEKQWGFCDAIVTGDTLYLSGVVAGTRDGDSNLEAAYARAFEHIAGILKKAGASWDDVVEITSYHTDVTAQMPAIVAVKNKYVRAPFPAWTAVQVVRLIPENGITEIKLVAKLPARVQSLKQ
jgi:enamine deaminase RidA (YjgF/YER057c/UK114 family)